MVMRCQENGPDYRAEQEYWLLFPFKDDSLVRSFGVELDCEKYLWRTVGEDLEEPRAKEEDMSRLSV